MIGRKGVRETQRDTKIADSQSMFLDIKPVRKLSSSSRLGPCARVSPGATMWSLTRVFYHAARFCYPSIHLHDSHEHVWESN